MLFRDVAVSQKNTTPPQKEERDKSPLSQGASSTSLWGRASNKYIKKKKYLKFFKNWKSLSNSPANQSPERFAAKRAFPRVRAENIPIIPIFQHFSQQSCPSQGFAAALHARAMHHQQKKGGLLWLGLIRIMKL